MIRIRIEYFTLFIVISSLISFLFSNKMLKIKHDNSLVYYILSTITLGGLTIFCYLDKLSLPTFGLALIICCTLFIFILKDFKFLTYLIVLKNFYLITTSLTLTFSLYEVVTKGNMIEINMISYIILCSLSLVIYVFLDYLIYSYLDKNTLTFFISNVFNVIPVSVLTLLILKNFSLFYILIFSRHAYLVSVLFLITCLLEIFFSVLIIFSILKAYNLSIYKYNNNILNLQYLVQANSLKRLQNYHDNIRKINHDFTNHKNTLYRLISENNNDEALKYLESLGTNLTASTKEIYTNNKTLNSLLLSKKEVCIENNIDLKLNIHIPKDISISDFDLCITVGNLIDNAIEATNKLNDNKYIIINSKIINHNFTLHVKNNYNGVIIEKNGEILTTKNDSINHGLGTQIIKSTIEKYYGTCNFTHSSDEFSSLITIPLS